MKILHLTDLHLSTDNDLLSTAWMGVDKVIDGQTFNFVVISGDLTNKAHELEFLELQNFLTENVVSRVKDRERRRVVLVPGNHDVQWDADLGEEIAPEKMATDPSLRDEIEGYLSDPSHSDLRLRFGAHGLECIRRIDWARYASRLTNFQRFLKVFYARSGQPRRCPKDRDFALDYDEAHHFSAHVFEAEKVVFYGLSSCHRNDRDWRGAGISDAAIRAVKDHIRAYTKDFVKDRGLAPWPHQCAGIPRSPDASRGRLPGEPGALSGHPRPHPRGRGPRSRRVAAIRFPDRRHGLACGGAQPAAGGRRQPVLRARTEPGHHPSASLCPGQQQPVGAPAQEEPAWRRVRSTRRVRNPSARRSSSGARFAYTGVGS